MPSNFSTEFASVVTGNHASLRFYIRSLGVDSAWVDDIAQETFLLLHQKWTQLDDHSRLNLWLRTAARNLVRNEVRTSSRRPRLINKYLTTLQLEHSSQELSPDDHAIAAERKNALRKCLLLLTSRSREIVHERYFKDRNSSEIANDLGMQAAAVRRILLRARDSLAACIKQEVQHPSQS